MSKANQVTEKSQDEMVVQKAKDFWTRYQKVILIASTAIILLAGGYLGYKNFYKLPAEKKAVDALYRAEEYYRMDSLQKALNGDLASAGFLKIIDRYGGTKAANLARFYAGDCFIRLGNYAAAQKHLEKFKTESKPMQAAAYSLLGSVYAEQNKNDDAIRYYKKAAHHFPEDNENASLYLALAAGLCEKTGKKNEAIELYKELKEKYYQTTYGYEADKHLGKLGVYN